MLPFQTESPILTMMTGLCALERISGLNYCECLVVVVVLDVILSVACICRKCDCILQDLYRLL